MTKSNKSTLSDTSRLFNIEAKRPMAMLARCPVYQPTPLIKSSKLANQFGIAELFIKDETARMGLGSFKALGGSFAVAQMILDATGRLDVAGTDAEGEQSKPAVDMTFITASAGNHGLSVAAGARIFGAKAVIVLSSTVPKEFASRIAAMNADVVWVDGSYEDSIARAIELADKNNWLLLADGSWEGYTKRPALVMEGYSVLAEECRVEFSANNNWPTHIFLQAGVGGLAAAVAGHVRRFWNRQPQIIIVEPEAAQCLARSVEAGHLARADGPVSNMGRLDCKDASLIAFLSLKDDADEFIAVSDEQADQAALLLGQQGFATTASGAAAIAGLLITKLDQQCRCLVIATEGQEQGRQPASVKKDPA